MSTPTPTNSPATSPTKPSRTAAAPTPNSSPTRGPRIGPLPLPLAAPKAGTEAPPPTLSSSPTRRPKTRRRPASSPAATPKPREQGIKSDEAIRMAKKDFGVRWEDTAEERQRRVEEKRHRRWLDAAAVTRTRSFCAVRSRAGGSRGCGRLLSTEVSAGIRALDLVAD
ncbi:hypothetical protein PpBr36_02531 [Pyricularia pennisetigena]|uniref:hypothetical protein n=1 Tax=Pyricularia pennisetigena TaxID=1578925 RepID=UPI00114E98F2|nr:hypothetical protein PpBr36_02531 [Pyricularia pennisetigena]TLS31446.1 hypothetical protein PpBr36_02531 [Pyricularia pennisetigena]